MAGKSLITRAADLLGSRAATARVTGISNYTLAKAARGELSGDRQREVNAQLRGAIDRARAFDGKSGGAAIDRALSSVSKSALSSITGLSKSQIDKAARGQADDKTRAAIEKFANGRAGREAREKAIETGKRSDIKTANELPAVKRDNWRQFKTDENAFLGKIARDLKTDAGALRGIIDTHRAVEDELTRLFRTYRANRSKAGKDRVMEKISELYKRKRNVENTKEFQALRRAGLKEVKSPKRKQNETVTEHEI